jgi:outer membrane protein assembly factor BamB
VREHILVATVGCLFVSVACLAEEPTGGTPASKGTPAAGSERARPGSGRPRKFELDQDGVRVLCRDASGKVLWSTRLEGYLGLVRPPHLVWDAERVYVTNDGGVTCLSRDKGKVLWHAKGPEDCLLLSDGLLLAADCTSDSGLPADGRWLVARATATGKTIFRVRLPIQRFDPLPIREVAGLFMVEPFSRESALLFDRKGRVHYRFDRQVVAGMLLDKDRVFATDRDVVRVSPDGQTRWAIPFRKEEWLAGGQLLKLKNGDLLASLYGRITDSGVQVIRLDPATGKQVWQARCAGLGVGHSVYWHKASMKVGENRVTVTSRAAGGTFVEILDLDSGRQVKRTRQLER